jgi:hypothetical protein
MKAAAMSSDSRAKGALDLPTHPIAGLAGISFKHEHLTAILLEGRQDSPRPRNLASRSVHVDRRAATCGSAPSPTLLFSGRAL